nr:hypothetical protein Iba_chr09fCG1160 [Ipomoea batatas]
MTATMSSFSGEELGDSSSSLANGIPNGFITSYGENHFLQAKQSQLSSRLAAEISCIKLKKQQNDQSPEPRN